MSKRGRTGLAVGWRGGLTLFKRNESGPQRARDARPLRDCARRRLGLVPPFVIEELEHRVLLTNPGLQPVPFFAAGFPPATAAISPLTRYPTLAVENMQAVGQSVIVPCAGEYSTLALAHLAIPQATPGSVDVDLAPGITEDGGTTSPIVMEGAPRGQGTPNGGASDGRWSRNGLVSEPGRLHPTATFDRLGPSHIARRDEWRRS